VRDAALPGWPAVLHETWAAAYLSLSTTTFRSTVVPDVPPIELTAKRRGWRRTDLDAWIAKRAGDGAPSPNTSSWDDA
jgi:hypothetical protein